MKICNLFYFYFIITTKCFVESFRCCFLNLDLDDGDFELPSQTTTSSISTSTGLSVEEVTYSKENIQHNYDDHEHEINKS